MTIQDYNYTHSEAEFEEMRGLVIESYQTDKTPLNWRLGLLENWKYASMYLQLKEYFTQRVHLWRQESKLVGFCIRYYENTHLQIHPEFRRLEANMLVWAERNWGSENKSIRIAVFEHDWLRQELLERRGYRLIGQSSFVRLYDLTRDYPQASLPAGYQFMTMAEYGDITGRLVLENKIWNRIDLDEAWFRGKSSAPTYSPDWDLLVVDPEGQPAASSLIWVYASSESGEIEPLGTHPDHRGRGLARAMVLETFHRLRARGMRYAYIASDPDPNYAANHLYASLQPVETYHEQRWVKHFN